MKKLPCKFVLVRALRVQVLGLGLLLLGSCGYREDRVADLDRQAGMYPDYRDISIPPNIAPLNFLVEEEGKRFRVEFRSQKGRELLIRQSSPLVRIPVKDWKRLLDENQGDSIWMDISTLGKEGWIRFRESGFYITKERVDPTLSYRKVHATYLLWHRMGIYQRDLESFEEQVLVENQDTEHGCMNCHAFPGNDPSKMMLHFRIKNSGTLIWTGDTLTKINTKASGMPSAGIYPSFHPAGTHIAFSVGKLSPHLTSRLNKAVDVADRESDLVVYELASNTLHRAPETSTAMRENLPVWAADGRSLFYIRAPEAVPGNLESLLHARYSLMKIEYNTHLNTWGEPETILHADSIGRSISMPSVSPDGRYLSCSLSDHGYFTIFHKGSDLGIIDLESGELRIPDMNSAHAESFSSWSSNGRWIVFSSKRMDGVFSRPHLAYVDEGGSVHKAFVVPQKDPTLYRRLQANYNIPRLITGPVKLESEQIVETFHREAREVLLRQGGNDIP